MPRPSGNLFSKNVIPLLFVTFLNSILEFKISFKCFMPCKFQVSILPVVLPQISGFLLKYATIIIITSYSSTTSIPLGQILASGLLYSWWHFSHFITPSSALTCSAL